MIWPDGSTHWCQSQGRGLYAADGPCVGATGTMMDVTQRKSAEDHDHLLTAALQSSADAVVLSDRTGCIEWVIRRSPT
jgi:PAS domain-containing protein